MKKTYNMKNKTATLIVLFLMALGVNAQVDRSKQPASGPEPKIKLEVPQEFELKNGLKVLVVENHKLPRVSYSLTIDNNPIASGDKAGVENLIGSMLGNGTTTIPKDAFNEEIDFLGASLNFGFSGAYASSLSKYSDRILELMADAALHPLLTEEEFNKEKVKLIEDLKSNEKSMDAISDRVGSALSFGKNHPSGEFVTEATLNNVTYGDALAFYEKYFNPNNSYLVVIGDVNFKTIKKQIQDHFGKWEKSVDVSTALTDVSPNVKYTQINFVDLPTASQSSIYITNNVDLKMSDKDYHAALITNNILGGGGEGYLFKNLREARGYTYGAYSSLGASRFGTGRFSAGAKVRNMVTDSAVVEALKEIKRIRTEPVDAQTLKDAKAKYVGNFIMGLEQPQNVARYALNIKLNNLPKDFYETYLQKINAVTIEDVERVAKKYFQPENARIVVVGKGSEVVENLEKTGIPILFFDKYANPVDKPVFSKPLPVGLTAQTILDTYLTAIGGMDKAKTVKSVYMTADVTVEGVPIPLSADLKIMAPNKESMEISAEGMGVLMKEKFDGTTGYKEQQGMRMELTEKELTENKAKHSLFPEMYYDAANVSLENVSSIDGKDTYKVKVTENGEESFRYYDAITGLLTRVEGTVEAQGQMISSSVDYNNYSDVNGIKFPYTQAIKNGPQVVNLNIKNIKVNDGVSDADFK